MKTRQLQIEDVYYFHLPCWGSNKPVKPGSTLRQALRNLRKVGPSFFGNIGTMNAYLSDGTELSVLLREFPDRTWLMNSQEILRRTGSGKIIRRYTWR